MGEKRTKKSRKPIDGAPPYFIKEIWKDKKDPFQLRLDLSSQDVGHLPQRQLFLLDYRGRGWCSEAFNKPSGEVTFSKEPHSFRDGCTQLEFSGVCVNYMVAKGLLYYCRQKPEDPFAIIEEEKDSDFMPNSIRFKPVKFVMKSRNVLISDIKKIVRIETTDNIIILARGMVFLGEARQEEDGFSVNFTVCKFEHSVIDCVYGGNGKISFLFKAKDNHNSLWVAGIKNSKKGLELDRIMCKLPCLGKNLVRIFKNHKSYFFLSKKGGLYEDGGVCIAKGCKNLLLEDFPSQTILKGKNKSASVKIYGYILTEQNKVSVLCKREGIHETVFAMPVEIIGMESGVNSIFSFLTVGARSKPPLFCLGENGTVRKCLPCIYKREKSYFMKSDKLFSIRELEQRIIAEEDKDARNEYLQENVPEPFKVKVKLYDQEIDVYRSIISLG